MDPIFVSSLLLNWKMLKPGHFYAKTWLILYTLKWYPVTDVMLIRVKVNILYSYVECGKLGGKRGGTGGTAHSTGEKASAQTVSNKLLNN